MVGTATNRKRCDDEQADGHEGWQVLPVSSWYTDGSSRAVVSTDHEATFAELGAASISDKKSRSADEHMIIERKDASLWMLVCGKFAAVRGIGLAMPDWYEPEPQVVTYDTTAEIRAAMDNIFGKKAT